jgi:hypothetical protein
MVDEVGVAWLRRVDHKFEDVSDAMRLPKITLGQPGVKLKA